MEGAVSGENPGVEAVGPDKDIQTAREWSGWIKSSLKDFSGNIDNAGILMSSFCDGSDYVFSGLEAEGLKGIVKPKIAIVTSGNIGSPFGTPREANLILVEKTSLEEYSLVDVNAQITITRVDGEVPVVATMVDYFGLAGVEETHHAIFNQIKGDKAPDTFKPLDASVAEYDAQQSEFRALRWQLKYAKHKDMPEETRDKIQERVDKATEVRSSKRVAT